MKFSIRRLIYILVVVSSFSLLVLGMSAIVSNFMMNNNQEELIAAIRVESLSGNISNLIASDLVRQENYSNSERNSSKISVSQSLTSESPFYAFHEQLMRLSIDFPKLNETAVLLKIEYDNFMRAEQAIISNMNDTISLRLRLKNRVKSIDTTASMIRKKSNSISGKLMLRQARSARSMSKDVLDTSLSVNQMQDKIQRHNSSNGIQVQRLSNNVKGDFLKFLALTHRLRNETNMDQLNNIRFNTLIQPMNKVNYNLKKMRSLIKESDPLSKEVLDMLEVFSSLSNSVLYNSDSVYELRKSLNSNETALVKTRASLFNNVLNINAQISKLKHVVTQISQEVIPASKRLSSIILTSVSVLAVIFLMLFAFLGRHILKVITGSLNQLIEAMIDISSGKTSLDKRVAIPPQKELAKLSNSFNDMIAQLQLSQEDMRKLNKAYQKFVPEKGLELLGSSSITEIRLGDHIECAMSVLFSDIRDFTSITEKMTTSESFDFINEYLKVMEPIIEKHNGFIDKYIGDAVMALFPDELGADDAVRASIEMMTALKGLNADRKSRGLNAISIGVGVNTGDLVLGTIGGDIRMEETVIGDTVNVASRMESLNKQFGTQVLISEATFKSISPALELNVRNIGNTAIKGKADKAMAYEVYNHCSDVVLKEKEKITENLSKACAFVESDNVKEALKIFEECKLMAPNDPVVDYYISLLAVRSLRAND